MTVYLAIILHKKKKRVKKGVLKKSVIKSSNRRAKKHIYLTINLYTI